MVVVKIGSEKNGTMGVGVSRDSVLPKRMSQNSANASTSNACGKPLQSTRMRALTYSVRRKHRHT